MAHLILNDLESSTLGELLEHLLSDLRMEIVDTDRLDFKTRLRDRKVVLEEIAAKLERATDADPLASAPA
ncbi:MAG TPA: hypothetical protein VGN26_08755 [Armatimonadota bacterium]|jgi:hypothetical protein